jgi:hypothetical protein
MYEGRSLLCQVLSSLADIIDAETASAMSASVLLSSDLPL